MIKLFLDIETLPGNESLRRSIEAGVKPPGNISRAETIQKWEIEEKPVQIEKEFRDTALFGHVGRILCIGYLKENSSFMEEHCLTGDEPNILESFWNVAADVDLFVGFNVLEFDLRFIVQRSIIHKVKPSKTLSFARYRNNPIFDVMHEWTQWDPRKISLDTLSQAPQGST